MLVVFFCDFLFSCMTDKLQIAVPTFDGKRDSFLNYEEIESHYGHQKGTGLKHPLWLCVENGRASTRELVVHLLGNVQCRVRVVSSV